MYDILLSRPARKSLSKIPGNVRNTIKGKLAFLAIDPYAPNNNVTALTDSSEYRLRVGDYRVIYTLEDELRVLYVEKIGPRGSVYDA